ncbi:MAG: hypothetical protein II107_04755 [Prevotella sp.]|nr:hypothetical protein [Prevotella sp.]
MAGDQRVMELMEKLGISREEAEDLVRYDDDVEDGKKTKYDLTPEQQANVTAMNRKVEHQKGKGNRSQRKPNEVKESIIKELAEFLREDAQGQLYEEVTITNANRMITFVVNGKSYDLTLIEKRAPK